MGVSSSESHDLTAFYEMLSASFGVLSQNTGFYPSLDRIVETMLRPLNLGPGGRSYNKPISCLHWFPQIQGGGPKEPDLAQLLGWALSHQVSDSLTDRFTGVLMMRFKLREGRSLSMGNYIQE